MVLIGWLTIVTDAGGLPWLIKGLKIEHIEAPVEGSADSLLEEALSIFRTSDCSSIARATCGNSQ